MHKLTALFVVILITLLLDVAPANAQEEFSAGKFFGATRQGIVAREEPATPAGDEEEADATQSPASPGGDFVRPKHAGRLTVARFVPPVAPTPVAPEVAEWQSPQSSGGGNQNTPSPAVMTPGEKFEYGLRRAFLSPGAYVGPVFRAAFTTAREDRDVPTKTGADKFADFLSHYARGFGTGATTTIFSSGIYPIVFKQNPVYQPSQKKGTGARLLYAVSRVVSTRGDGGETQPNYSRLAGAFTGAAVSNLWTRDTVRERNEFGVATEFNRNKGVGPTFRRFGTSLGFNALSLVLNEFFGFGR